MSLLDRCIFTAASGGTVDFVVSAALAGYQTPSAANAVDGATYSYAAQSADLSQWEVGRGVYTAASTTLARTTVLFNSLGTTAKVNFSAAPIVMISALAEDLAAAGVTINTSPIAAGTSGRLLYDNAGTVGETAGVTWDSVNQTFDWLSPNSTYPSQSLVFKISSQDALNSSFYIGQGGFINPSSSRTDQVVSFGYNLAGSGRVSNTDHAHGIAFESYYNPSGSGQTEGYWEYISPDGTINRRPIFITIPVEGANANKVSVSLQADTIDFNSADGLTTEMFFSSGGIQMLNGGGLAATGQSYIYGSSGRLGLGNAMTNGATLTYSLTIKGNNSASAGIEILNTTAGSDWEFYGHTDGWLYLDQTQGADYEWGFESSAGNLFGASNQVIGWVSGVTRLSTNTKDTGISRSAAGVLAFGNGTQGDGSATILAKTKAGAPTTSDVPSGTWALIRDTTNSTTKMYYNNAGTLQTVALV